MVSTRPRSRRRASSRTWRRRIPSQHLRFLQPALEREATVSAEDPIPLELDQIQSGALRARPSPYAGTYILLRIDERRAGREMLRRVIPVIASAAHPTSPAGDAWVSAVVSFQGLKALGVPQASLDSFPEEFRQGMAARAAELGDIGESAPEKWEKPFGTQDVHVGLVAMAPNTAQIEALLARARAAY